MLFSLIWRLLLLICWSPSAYIFLKPASCRTLSFQILSCSVRRDKAPNRRVWECHHGARFCVLQHLFGQVGQLAIPQGLQICEHSDEFVYIFEVPVRELFFISAAAPLLLGVVLLDFCGAWKLRLCTFERLILNSGDFMRVWMLVSNFARGAYFWSNRVRFSHGIPCWGFVSIDLFNCVYVDRWFRCVRGVYFLEEASLADLEVADQDVKRFFKYYIHYSSGSERQETALLQYSRLIVRKQLHLGVPRRWSC